MSKQNKNKLVDIEHFDGLKNPDLPTSLTSFLFSYAPSATLLLLTTYLLLSPSIQFYSRASVCSPVLGTVACSVGHLGFGPRHPGWPLSSPLFYVPSFGDSWSWLHHFSWPPPLQSGADSYLGWIRSQGPSESTALSGHSSCSLGSSRTPLLVVFYMVPAAHVKATSSLLCLERSEIFRGSVLFYPLRCHQDTLGMVPDYRTRVNGLPTWW